MHKKILSFWVSLCLICAIGITQTYVAGETYFGENEPPKNVLFVGNSYTYFWNLPQLVHLMAKEKGIDLKTRQSTSGGVNLGMHWRGEKELKSQQKIKSGAFDVVVFQDHSMRSIEHPDSLLYFGKKLCDLAKENGAKPFIYMTWAREWNPLMQSQITKMYSKLAIENNATLVPVGKAWELARKLRPDIKLYDPDGSHSSTTGTYLTACVFFAVLTGESPIGLPKRLQSKDENGDPIYWMILSENDARFCQEVAAEILKN